MVQGFCPGLCPLLPSRGLSAAPVEVSQRAFPPGNGVRQWFRWRSSAPCGRCPNASPAVLPPGPRRTPRGADPGRGGQAGGAGTPPRHLGGLSLSCGPGLEPPTSVNPRIQEHSEPGWPAAARGDSLVGLPEFFFLCRPISCCFVSTAFILACPAHASSTWILGFWFCFF